MPLGLPVAPAQTVPPPVNAGGVLPIFSQAFVEQESRQQAENTNNRPVIQGLAAHIRDVWTKNKDAKRAVEERMLKALRQRRGEYDPEKLAKIKQRGGSEVYMMLTSVKCRAILSWLKDIMLSQRSEKPWTIDPTPVADIPPEEIQALMNEIGGEVQALAMRGIPVDPQILRQYLQERKDEMRGKVQDIARRQAEQAELYMEDQLVEGGFLAAFSEFLDDFVTFPSAIIKGPVPRKRRKLTWQAQVPTPIEAITFEWDRVDPFDIYPAPHASSTEDGDLIERHKLSRRDLLSLIGVEGYNEASIRAVLDEHGRNGLNEWLSIDTEKAAAEGRTTLHTMSNSGNLIDTLQYWGSVQGKLLLDWGMDAAEIADPLQEYDVEAWLIGRWVIKVVLNPDPLGRRPYYKTSYETIPGTFWGNGPPDLLRDCQDMCNSAARALANNMGIASGPQVWVNVDRLPPGEDVTNLYPWKIHLATNDPMGGATPPVGFFQPNSNAQELMAIYEKFSVLADEYSGIPRYMTGSSPTGGIGRTASGMSMLMTNAGKGIKQVIANLDQHIISPLVERLYSYDLQYQLNPDLRGDLLVVARGVNSLVVKESAQVRRNEFLASTANPIDMQILGLEGRAAVLREAAKALDMNTDAIVPSVEIIKMRQLQSQMQQMQQMQPPGPQDPQAPQGPQNEQTLQDESPITDNY